MPDRPDVPFEALVELLETPIVVTTVERELWWSNPSAKRLFGAAATGPGPGGEGQDRTFVERTAPLVDPATGLLLGAVREFTDVTERNLERQRLEGLTHTDPLTRVRNRRWFEQRLVSLLAADNGSRDTAVLGVIDVDRFKAVNDVLGHAVGDRTLVEVADKVTSIVGLQGEVARLGGDEFAFLLFDADVAEAEAVASQIIAELSAALSRFQDERADIGLSIGLTGLVPTDVQPEDPLARADIACYEAKHRGGAQTVVA